MIDRRTPPPVHTIGELALPSARTIILDNGIILHLYDGGTQQVNQLTLMWQGGKVEAPSNVTARLAATLPREDAAEASGTEISETLDFNGAFLRCAADSHHTMMTLTSIDRMTPAVLPVVRDIITCPTFPAEVFANCRDIERQEFMMSMSRVMNVATMRLMPMIKGINHPDARMETLEDFDDVTRDMVRDYHAGVCTGEGCHAFVGGRLTAPVRDGIVDMLSSLPSPHAPMQMCLEPYAAGAPGRIDTTLPGAVQAAVCIALPAPRRSHPDYVPLRFTVMALGGYFGSRLMKNIREDKGYTYGISAYLMGSREGSFINIVAQTDPRYVDLLIEEVGNEMTKLATVPMEADELLRLRQYISSTLMETLDSPFSIIDYYKTIQCVDIPADYFDTQVRYARSLDAETVMLMARRYLDVSEMRISVCK